MLQVGIPTRVSFQSTLPARGATIYRVYGHGPENISIHAPRTGSDKRQRCAAMQRIKFQSTLPARGATLALDIDKDVDFDFNPRSPHGERLVTAAQLNQLSAFQSTLPARGATFLLRKKVCKKSHFNPRSPHGERPVDIFDGVCQLVFQSTLPARGATWRCPKCREHRSISIHAPRTGSDILCP